MQAERESARTMAEIYSKFVPYAHLHAPDRIFRRVGEALLRQHTNQSAAASVLSEGLRVFIIIIIVVIIIIIVGHVDALLLQR